MARSADLVQGVGVAGTPAGGVLTVQGSITASGLYVPTDGRTAAQLTGVPTASVLELLDASANTFSLGRGDGGVAIARNRAHSAIAQVAGGANAAATVTLPLAGAGVFHYITHIRIVRVATAALAGTALLAITTTNLIGTPAWRVGNAMAAGGTQIDMDIEFVTPLRSSISNTSSTIVLPAAGAAVSWDAIVTYYTSAELK